MKLIKIITSATNHDSFLIQYAKNIQDLTPMIDFIKNCF